jgi:hypothetical protein
VVKCWGGGAGARAKSQKLVSSHPGGCNGKQVSRWLTQFAYRHYRIKWQMSQVLSGAKTPMESTLVDQLDLVSQNHIQ